MKHEKKKEGTHTLVLHHTQHHPKDSKNNDKLEKSYVNICPETPSLENEAGNHDIISLLKTKYTVYSLYHKQWGDLLINNPEYEYELLCNSSE